MNVLEMEIAKSSAEHYKEKAEEYEAKYKETGNEAYKRIADSLRLHATVLENGLEDWLNIKAQ